MEISRKRKLILIVVMVVAVAILGPAAAVRLFMDNEIKETYVHNGEVLVLDKNFRYVEPGTVSCLALSPNCGECFGQLVDKNCYIKKQ